MIYKFDRATIHEAKEGHLIIRENGTGKETYYTDVTVEVTEHLIKVSGIKHSYVDIDNNEEWYNPRYAKSMIESVKEEYIEEYDVKKGFLWWTKIDKWKRIKAGLCEYKNSPRNINLISSNFTLYTKQQVISDYNQYFKS